MRTYGVSYWNQIFIFQSELIARFIQQENDFCQKLKQLKDLEQRYFQAVAENDQDENIFCNENSILPIFKFHWLENFKINIS